MSLRAAINAKCKDCIYDRLAGGTWRAQVEACTATTCPLYPYRPTVKQRSPNRDGKSPQPLGLARYRDRLRESREDRT